MKIAPRVKSDTMIKIAQVHKAIDEIVSSGGRVDINDPLTRELYRLRKLAAQGK